MEAGGGVGGGGRQVSCQTAAVAGGRGLKPVTHTGKPCSSHILWGWGWLYISDYACNNWWDLGCMVCSPPLRSFIICEQKCHSIRVGLGASSSAFCLILVSAVFAQRQMIWYLPPGHRFWTKPLYNCHQSDPNHQCAISALLPSTKCSQSARVSLGSVDSCVPRLNAMKQNQENMSAVKKKKD